jgi:hypothetical protein
VAGSDHRARPDYPSELFDDLGEIRQRLGRRPDLTLRRNWDAVLRIARRRDG